jgi:hypothetical protein
MKIKGDRTIHEWNVEVEVSTRDLFDTIKYKVLQSLKLPPDTYISSYDGKLTWDEDTSTSHYSYRSHTIDATDEQLESVQALYKVGELLQKLDEN